MYTVLPLNKIVVAYEKTGKSVKNVGTENQHLYVYEVTRQPHSILVYPQCF